MSDETPSEKKIIIDEDWKSQVEAEREAARLAEEAAKAEKPAEPKKPAETQASAGARGPLPPASLSFLVSTLYLQGAMSLGLLPNPVAKKQEVQRDQASTQLICWRCSSRRPRAIARRKRARIWKPPCTSCVWHSSKRKLCSVKRTTPFSMRFTHPLF